MTAATGSPITVISFGYLHGAPPSDAHLTIDLRHHFRDPHVSPELRYMTAHDAPVRAAVMNTPGIKQLLAATVAAVDGFLAGPSSTGLTIADGCAGGRHRAATFAIALQAVLTGDAASAAELGVADLAKRYVGQSLTVDLVHRDLTKAVVDR